MRRSTIAASCCWTNSRSCSTPQTKIVAVAHVSNALGTINPVREIIELAHARNIPVLVDGAQAVPHMQGGRAGAGLRFLRFSGHKVYGPTGIGVLYGKRALLEAMPPYQGGGDMISSVTFEKTIYNKLPYKFEAGTPDIAGAIGLGAAIDYLNAVWASTTSPRMSTNCWPTRTEALSAIPGVRLIGTAQEKAGVLSFVIEDIHPHDIGTILDQEGIAIRTGHHCAQPVMQRFGIPATARASFALYNTREEIDALVRGHPKGAGGVRLMSDLRDLYQEVILEHSKAPRNFRELAGRQPQGGRLQPAVRRPLHGLS